MAECTVCVVTQNNLSALRLTVESFRRCNADRDFLLWVWCNNCTDGSIEWARANADRVFVKDGPLGHHHAQPLDHMVALVETPYVLTLDNDVMSLGPCLAEMLERARKTDAFAVAPTPCAGMGTVNHFGRELQGQPRIDPCCALFETGRLARMVEHVSFTPAEVTNLGKFYDTGGMIRAAAEAVGYRVEEHPFVRDAIRHYGSLTWDAEGAQGRDRMRAALADLAAMDRAYTYDLVVAKYNEDVRWAHGVPGRVFVYDKSDRPLDYAVRLPNRGREAGTYAEHVARNYDELSEVTVFAQGNPFDHAPRFLDEVLVPTARFRAIGAATILTGPNGDPCHTLPTGAIYKELTGRTFPADTPFSPGAQFAAHRDALRRYPRTWWRRLADRLNDADTQSTWPWALERMWRLLLAGPPVPHRYHKIFGWFCSHAMYRRMVDGAADGAHFVEVGAYAGKSTSFMATEIANSGKRIKFDVVDTFRGSDNPEEAFMKREIGRLGGSMRPTFERNMAGLEPWYAVREAGSVEAAAAYPDGSLDFVYIDADHAEESVRKDLRAWFPKVKPGGWIGGDDMTEAHPGVIRAVDAFFGYDTRISPVEWLAQKPPK